VPAPPPEDWGRRRQTEIYLAGVTGATPDVPTAPDRLEEAAKRKLNDTAFAYLAGGAGGEATLRANREAFGRWAFVPRVLAGVRPRDLSVDLLGRTLPVPLLFGPVGVLELAHPDADLAVARAAAEHGVPMVFSNQASVPMEDCAAALGDAPRWFQLYWSTEDDLVDSFLERAEHCGAEAVVVTLDTTILGWRPRDLDLGSLPFAQGKGLAQYTSDPVFRRIVADRLATDTGRGAKPKVTPTAVRSLVSMSRHYPGRFRDNIRSPEPRAAVQTFLEIYSRPSLSWADLAGLRTRTRLPIVLKGVLHPDDARRAADHGVDAVIVSNHGGRQVDHAIAALDALPEVVDAAGDLPVLMDSGIRSGADVAVALAMGARAVLLGRAYAYGLAIAGQAGVEQVLANITAELDLTMALIGVSDIAGLTRELLVRR
jgi:L-lactate dehydrogenase (cytochrome)